MLNPDVVRDAKRMAFAICERVDSLSKRHGSPCAISLAIYTSQHDFTYLRPDDPWTWEHHTAVAKETQRQLKTGNSILLNLVECTAEGCAIWLNERGMIGTTANRAAYVAFISQC